MIATANQIAIISKWIDDNAAFVYRENPTLALYGRVTKVYEEYGEVLEAVNGGNVKEIAGELADVSLTALCAWYHITPDANRLAGVIRANVSLVIYMPAPDSTRDIYRVLAPLGQHCGKTVQTLIGATGQNPRKGFTHNLTDVADCLSGIAGESMMAAAAITGNPSLAIGGLYNRVGAVIERAGLAV